MTSSTDSNLHISTMISQIKTIKHHSNSFQWSGTTFNLCEHHFTFGKFNWQSKSGSSDVTATYFKFPPINWGIFNILRNVFTTFLFEKKNDKERRPNSLSMSVVRFFKAEEKDGSCDVTNGVRTEPQLDGAHRPCRR